MYTNGFDNTRVLAALVGRLGWSDTSLNTANQTSNSGRKFDDGSFHNLVTVANIKATTAAPVSPATWDSYFTNKQNAVILRCLNGIFNQAESLEQTLLYDRYGNVEQTVDNDSSFIGYKIKVANDPKITTQVNKAILYFDGAETFNIYLFKDGSTTPVKTKSVTTVANDKTIVDLTDWHLNYLTSGIYYVGYFQDDLNIVNAIQEQATFNPSFCFGAISIKCEATGATTFQRDELSYTSLPHGLNLQISSFKDYTEAIVKQPYLFDEAIGRTMEFVVLEGFITSTESSKVERILKDNLDKAGLQIYLYGVAAISEGPRIKGLDEKLNKIYSEVRTNFLPKPGIAQTINLC